MIKLTIGRALQENFTEEDLLNTLQSDNLEKKFILALQLLFTDKSELGFALLKTLNLSTLIDEHHFAEDLLVNELNPKLSSHNFLKLILFVITQNPAMAIQKHLSNYTPQKPQDNDNLNIIRILQIIEYVEKHQEKITTTRLIQICEMLINEMSKLPLPREADELKMIRPNINEIGDFFRKLTIPNEERLRFLELIYNYLANPVHEPTALISLGFLVIPDMMITQALEYFFKVLPWSAKKTKESIVTAMGRLICWLRTSNMPVPIDTWIIKTILVLNNNGLYDIIDEVAKKNIVPAFLTLLVPLFQSKTLPVVQSLLENSRNTKELIRMIAPRASSMLKQLESTKSDIFEPLMELICDSLGMIEQSDPQYKEIINFLEFRKRFPSKVIVKKFIGPSNYGCLTTSNNARVGLENLGNTCYLNSILQALFMTKQFCREILTTQRSDQTVFEIQKLFALMLCSPRPEQNPKSVINLIRPDDFLPGIQHDSSEFLGSLLDRLHEQEKKRLKDDDEDWDVESNCNSVQNISMQVDNKKSIYDSDDKTFKECHQQAQDKIVDNTTDNIILTYIQKIFGGKISTRYFCSKCNSNSVNVDSFRDLQLSFPEKTHDDNCDMQYNVQQLLEYYFSTEELTLVGDNQYHCDNCKIKCNGIRCTEILESPKNLILTLKHFRYDSRHHTRSKLLYKVFHDEIITVNVKGSFQTNSSRNVDYKLYAAVIHSGTSLDSGHYFTIARESDTKWFKFNDSYVTKSSLDELRSLISPNTPYILFYQRLSTASATVVHSESENGSSSSSAMFTNQNTDSFPEYEELSQYLRDFINEDKSKFEHDTAIQKNQTAYGRMYPTIRDNNNHFDDDPGSGSNYNFNDSYAHNRFIY